MRRDCYQCPGVVAPNGLHFGSHGVLPERISVHVSKGELKLVFRWRIEFDIGNKFLKVARETPNSV